MTVIELTTVIVAPVRICFELALSIDLVLEMGRSHHMRAVSGLTSGRIGAGERVGWKIKQFGITVSHVSEITGYEPPTFFEDRMVAGIFRSFQHDHFFRSVSNQETEMRDLLRFEMPFWLMGRISERLIVRRRFIRLLLERNQLLKRAAESFKLKI